MSSLATFLSRGRGFKSVLKLLISGLGVFAASTADASPAGRDTPIVIIHYSTASLATDSGVHALYRRIEMAAEKVCLNEPANSRLPNEAVIKCWHDTIAVAVARINNQRLAILYAANSKSD